MWTSSSPFALHVLATRVAITMQEFRLEQVGDPCQPQKLEVGQPYNYSEKNEVDQFGSLWEIICPQNDEQWMVTYSKYLEMIKCVGPLVTHHMDPHGWFRGDGWRSMNGWKNWIGRRTTRHGRMAAAWRRSGWIRCSQDLHGRSGSKRSLL